MAMRLSLIINADGSAAIEAIDRVRGSVGNLDREAGRAAGGGMAGLTSQLKSLAMTAAAGIGVAELARAFVSVNVATERTQKALEAVTGSTALAQQEMAYLREVANRMGIGLQDAASAYVSLSAAAKGTALEGQAAKDIFEAVSLAMGKLGKSSADTEGALLAIQQMMSKGTVQAEELRGQLGERLPGAFGLAAKAMGVTEQELGKMLEKGEILAKDLLPALTDELNKTYNDGKRIGGLDKEWERFKTAMEQSAVGINQVTDATKIMGEGLQWATGIALQLATGLQAIANYRQGFGLQTFADDASKLAYMVQQSDKVRQQMLDLVNRQKSGDYIFGGFDASYQPLLDQFKNLTLQAKTLRDSMDATAIAADKQNQAVAASVGPNREMYEQNLKNVRENEIATVKLAGAYDEQAAKQAKIMEYQDKLNESVKQYTESNGKLGISQEVANKHLAEYTKSLDKNDKGHKAAAASVKAFDKDFAALVHQFLPARDDAEKLAKAEAILDQAMAKGKLTASEKAKAMEKIIEVYGQATNETQKLIDKYDREGAALREFAKDRQDFNDTIAAGGPQAEQARLALEKLTKQEQEAALEAVKSAGGFKAAWVEGVQSLTGVFEGLWKGLITGQKDVLKSLKSYLMDWVSRLSYELLLKPIILPIQTSLYNMAGVGMPGVTGASGATGGLSGMSSLSSIGSWFTGSSMGTSLASGLSYVAGSTYGAMPNWFGSGMSSLAMTPNWAMGIGGIGGSLLGNALFGNKGYGSIGSTIGSTIGTAVGGASSAAITAALGIAIPGIGAIIGGILGGIGGGGLGSLFGNKEPKWGALIAQTGGKTTAYEDSAYAKGAFGLSFGLNDKGSKNVDASKLQPVFQGLADVTTLLAKFFGEDLSNFIKDDLAKLTAGPYDWLHLTENEQDLAGAMNKLVEQIAASAGRSGQELGLAFQGMLGTLSGTAEEVGAQIESAMQAAALAVEVSKRWDDQLGQMLGLTGDLASDVDRLRGYAGEFGKASETSAQTLTRLVSQLGLLATAAEQTATKIDGLSTAALVKLSDGLVKAFGSLEKATSAMTVYQDQFVSATAKLVKTIKAAAGDIDREIPKLQDRLRQLGEDVTKTIIKTVDQTVEAVAQLRTDLSGLDRAYYDIMLEGAKNWTAELDNDIARLVSLKTASPAPLAKGLIDAIYEEIDAGLGTFGDYLRDLGYEVDQGAQVFIDSLRTLVAGIDDAASQITVTETLTIPGDPNATILASLLDSLPKTRAAFNDLIAGIDLTTEAGQRLYAGLIELAPQFDLLYDGVEAFSDWLLGVDEAGKALRELTAVFDGWGMSLPANRDALLSLYHSGVLTTEQIAILGAYVRELGLVFGDLATGTAINPGGSVTTTGATLADRAQAAYDALAKSVDAQRTSITAAYQARITALSAERQAIQQAGQERLKALAAERQAAQTALSAAQSALSSIQSAIASLRGAIGVDEFSRVRAQRQLASWAASGALPSQEELSKVLPSATAINPADFATEAAYRLSQGATLANLLKLEQSGIKQVSVAEQTLSALDAQTQAIQDANQAQLDALQNQLDASAAWRDQQLARLDQLLATAKQQLDQALGQDTTTLSLAEALQAFNTALAALDQQATPLALATLGDRLSLSVADTGASLSTELASQATQQALATSQQREDLTALRAEIATLRADLAAIATQQLIPLKSVDDRLRRWDVEGLSGSVDSGTGVTVLRAA